MELINLVDLDFNSFSDTEKRIAFIGMDMVMQRLHENGKFVTSFLPQDIYYNRVTTLFEFGKVANIDSSMVDSKEDAIRNNIIGLTTLGFCSFLKSYDPKDGLLNNSVIAADFEKFNHIIDTFDLEYYRSVLVDCVKTGTLPKPLYYSQAVLAKENEIGGAGNSRLLVKTTEVGKAMADNNESAFGTQFFLVSMVACTMIAILGIILYFVNI
jgi:hypothetical protein